MVSRAPWTQARKDCRVDSFASAYKSVMCLPPSVALKTAGSVIAER